MTLGKRLDEFKGIGPGFDHLRVGLSLAILFWHSFGLSYGTAWVRGIAPLPVPPILAGLLPMFFALSGFLVMGSALRVGNLRVFITFRVLRILPALFTEISLSALVLGPLLTVVPLGVYFTSPQFFEYFGSLIGRVRYMLPGLFLTNPAPMVVNGALWTVGPEILCYIIIALLMLTGFYRNRMLMVVFTIFYTLVCLMTDRWDAGVVHEILPTKALILAFLTGNLLFLFRERVRYSLILAAATFAGSVLAAYLVQRDTGLRFMMYPAAAGFAYVTAVIGLTKLPPLPFFHRGDYSYGIYIYGYPIQQSVVHFLPDHREWWVNMLISLPITLLFAVASWHLVEKPVLSLRKRFLPGGQTVAPRASAHGADGRKTALAVGLIVYGVFVADAAKVFPLRPIARDFMGKPQTVEHEARPQF
jgi:peptidoglycan/LPS O-acetylase OafA/YrhL